MANMNDRIHVEYHPGIIVRIVEQLLKWINDYFIRKGLSR